MGKCKAKEHEHISQLTGQLIATDLDFEGPQCEEAEQL